VLVLTALHCRAAAPGTGGSWLAAGCASISRWNAKIRPTHHARSGRLGADVGARRTPLRVRRLHVSSHMGSSSGFDGSTSAHIWAAHIWALIRIIRCLTNAAWGMGYPSASIDDASFRAAADTLAAEGFGLNLIWLQQSTIEQFVREVMDHI